MNIIQFFKVLRARWIMIVSTAICAVVGAFIVTLILPPRWDGTARVMLNTLKPDPVTGQIIGNAALQYAQTQMSLIKDYTVASRVPDALGWLSDPALINSYQHRGSKDQRDFTHWAADLIQKRTKTKLVDGSNIIEITYSGTSAQNARDVAETLRKAYLDTNLGLRRDQAGRAADWYQGQAEKAKADLDAAEQQKDDFQRASGIVMANDKTDIDTERLQALATAGALGAPASVSAPPVGTSAASQELVQIDSAIAEASKTLGPNHPQLQALRSRREAIAAIAAKEDSAAARAASGAAASAAAAGAGALDHAVQSQKARVFAERDKVAKLSQLQMAVDVKRELFDKIQTHEAELRMEAAAGDTGITALGSAETPRSPAFPNMPLIIFGSLGLGLAFGVVVALLMELLNRRVRGVDDLRQGMEVPLIAVISGPPRGAGMLALPRPGRFGAK